MSLKLLWDNYQDDKEFEIKETTWAIKRQIVELKIFPYLGELSITQIDERVIRKWQNQMQSLSSKSGKPYSQTYLKRINNELSAIINHAVKFYKLPYNPLHVTGSIGQKHADEKQHWTLEQFNYAMQFYSEWDGSRYQRVDVQSHKLVFNILFFTGIRLGELLALTGNDFKYGKLSITKSYARLKKRDIISTPKTKSSIRIISVPTHVTEMLDEYIKTIYDYNPNDRLFPQITKSNISKQLKFISEKAELPRIRTHDLRHSHASLLIKEGVKSKVIQKRLGHKDIQTTLNTYSHLWEGADDEVSDLLNNLSPK
ncbi:tyrosine-type recombinase/integrase [Aerococcus urinaeequi]|uniref:tyrosine-type recombinase/integrase n=1 Tax=Aerococcus urinaeequi TaxID=51665 RepID=UPI0039BC9E3D